MAGVPLIWKKEEFWDAKIPRTTKNSNFSWLEKLHVFSHPGWRGSLFWETFIEIDAVVFQYVIFDCFCYY